MLYIRQQEADIMRRLFQRHLIRRNAKGLFLLNGEARAELAELTGIAGLDFCHIHGYLLGAENKEAAIEACCKSVDQNK